MASSPWTERTVDVRVEYGTFCLQEADEDFVPEAFPDGRSAGDSFLTPYEGRVDVLSAGHTHTAVLKAQVWSGEPPEEAGEWEARGECELYSETGRLTVWCSGGPTLGAGLELGTPRVRWRVRVLSKGRQEVARLAAEGVPQGIERYVAQLWPTSC